MATNVGSVAVEILRGNRAPESQRVDIWFVPGQTGIGAQLMGQNQSNWAYEATLYGVPADTEARLVSLAALQGFIVSIEDDHGEVRANNLVVSVGTPRRVFVIRDGVNELRAVVIIRGVVTA